MPKRSRLSRNGRIRIIPVTQFNQEAYARWQEAVDKWKPSTGGFPSLAMYQFIGEKTGSPRRKGFVASTGKHHLYAPTKKELMKKVREEM